MKSVRWIIVAAVLLGAGCTSSSTPGTGTSGTPGAGSTSTGSGATAPADGSSVPRTTAGRAPGTVPAGADAFCDAMRRANASGGASSTNGTNQPSKQEVDAFLAVLHEAQSAGPPELHDAFATMIDTFEQFADLGPNDVDKAMGLFFDPKVLDASDRISAFTLQRCGFALRGSSSDSGTGGSGSGSGGSGSGGSGSGGSGGTSLAADDDRTSIAAVKRYVEERADAAAWVQPIVHSSSWSSSGFGDEFDWEVQLVDVGSGAPSVAADDAVAACKLMAAYLVPLQSGVAITIKAASGAVLASQAKGAGCVAG